MGVLIPLSRPQLHYNQYADVPGPPARLECRLRGCTCPSHSTIGACIVTPGVKSVKIRKPRPRRLTAGFGQLSGSHQPTRAPALGTCPSYGPRDCISPVVFLGVRSSERLSEFSISFSTLRGVCSSFGRSYVKADITEDEIHQGQRGYQACALSCR